MMARVVRRLSRSELIDQIVVATTTKVSDDTIVAECRRLKASVFREKMTKTMRPKSLGNSEKMCLNDMIRYVVNAGYEVRNRKIVGV